VKRTLRLVAAFAAVAIVAFALGRTTAPDSSSSACAGRPQVFGRLALSQDLAPSGVGYYSQCESGEASVAFTQGKLRAIDVYADETGDRVIARWYTACGFPEGIVAPNEELRSCPTSPATSADAPSATTAVAPSMR
jgi:hypothetical protein